MVDGGREQDRPRAGRAITWPPRETTAASVLPGQWWRSLAKSNLQWIRAEAGPGRLLPRIPVAFGIGIAHFFATAREPVAAVVAPVAGIACALALAVRRRSIFPYNALS